MIRCQLDAIDGKHILRNSQDLLHRLRESDHIRQKKASQSKRISYNNCKKTSVTFYFNPPKKANMKKRPGKECKSETVMFIPLIILDGFS